MEKFCGTKITIMLKLKMRCERSERGIFNARRALCIKLCTLLPQAQPVRAEWEAYNHINTYWALGLWGGKRLNSTDFFCWACGGKGKGTAWEMGIMLADTNKIG
jgi:hypothetical protein